MLSFKLITCSKVTTPIANGVEEVVAEELLPYKELFTPVLPGQDHKAAATSCFCVYSSS